ncbi:MAG TPA: diacylglycerol kinase family protein [Micropepsaceae bacterium]|nr:diacylglycerol kinase family protein [Micropepsaceae bacterium]
MTVAKPRRILVILNAAASGFFHRPVRDICKEITSGFAAHGIATEIALAFNGSLDRRARDAAAAGSIDAVIAGGGDGTAGAVAAGLAQSNMPFGILPLGRSNHFARDLGIPDRLDQAIGVIARGSIATVDAGEVNGRLFINNSSLGAYPFLLLDRKKWWRRPGVLRPMAMLLAGYKFLRQYPLRRFSVRAGNQAEIWRTPLLFVGNNRYELDPFAAGRREQLNGGELWVYIARQQTRLSLIWFSLQYLLGLSDPLKDLRVFHAASIEIGLRSPKVTLAMDGELVQLSTPLHYRIRPAALRVYAPVPEDKDDAVGRAHF